MKTTLQLATVLLVAALAAGAAAQNTPERIKKAGKLVIATQPNYAPISYKDPASNQLMGFDVELGEAIAKELGVKVEWQETAFAQMISSLVTGRVDIVMAGMSDLPGRREQVDFVDYLRTGREPFAFAETVELMKLLIAGLRSRREGGRTVLLSEIFTS